MLIDRPPQFADNLAVSGRLKQDLPPLKLIEPILSTIDLPVGQHPTLPEIDWVRNAKEILKNSGQDFHVVKARVYWRDMLLGVLVAYSAAGVYLAATPFSLLQIVAYVVAIFWLYRVGSLIHEVAHLGGHELSSFKVAWNLLVGVPTLTPSIFFTQHHRDHHTQRIYGTPEDPEYVVNVCPRGSVRNLMLYFVAVALFPIAVFLRFLLTPLTYATPGIRDFSLRHLSAFTFNWKYQRSLARINRKTFATLEGLCFLRAVCIPGVVLLGFAPGTRILQLYLLGAAVVILNQLRQLADHHFEGSGERMSMSDHIGDSCNYANRDWLTWIFFPFAIQYHALHHLFPSLPYHNLASAHQYLMRSVPADSPYRALEQKSWWSVARKMLRS